MRLFQSFALVSCLVSLSACAAEEPEETGETSDAIATAAGFVYADGNVRKGPSTSTPILSTVNDNTRLVVYCSATNAEGTWLASNVDSRFARSYVHESTLQLCLTSANKPIGCELFVRGLAPCPAPAAGASSGAPPGGPALVARTAPADAVVKVPRSFTRDGYFNEPVNVTRTARGTFTVGAIWNAYDASGKLRGTGSCGEGTYSFDAQGVFDCRGSTTGATRFDVTYYARGPAGHAARF